MGLSDEQKDFSGDFADIKFELKLLTDRIARAEYVAQQAQAHIASEKQRVEDSIADRVKTETAALKAQMVAELRTRIVEAQNQLSQKVALLVSRDGEIAELKIQIQNFTQLALEKNAAQVAAVQPPQSAIVVKAPGETMPPTLKPAAASETNSMMHSFDAEVDGSNEQRRQLQQRISADIERVRAELRKRAGVSQ